MNEEQIALARRAVACKGWRWMPGMLTTCDLRVVDGGDEYVVGHRSGPTRDGGGWYDGEAAGLLPDLTDPATLGCLLALVREAWGLPLLGVAFDHDAEEWIVRSWNATILWQGLGNTEAEALLVALEAKS
jgi:hypothetical protein